VFDEIHFSDSSVVSALQPYDFSQVQHFPLPPPNQGDVNTIRFLTKRTFTFPVFEGINPAFPEWLLSVQNQILKVNQGYLLRESETNAFNHQDSQVVAMDFFDKLTGAALHLFSSTQKYDHNVIGGRGIEMLQLLNRTFMNKNFVGDLFRDLHSLKLGDTGDLFIFRRKVEDICSRFALVNQCPPKSFLVHQVQNILKTSRYRPTLLDLLLAHDINRTAFLSIDALFPAFHQSDRFGISRSVIAPSGKKRLIVESLVRHSSESSFGVVSSTNVSSEKVCMYFSASHCVGSASAVHTFSDTSSLKSSPKIINVIADSGATDNMSCYGKEVYISYKRLQNSYVVLANKQTAKCLGVGKIKLIMNGHPVIIHNVLHVPSLRTILYSVRQHRRTPGCSFTADNDGTFLNFKNFSIPIDSR